VRCSRRPLPTGCGSRGHTVHLGHRVRSLTPDAQGPAGRWLADGEPFDRVILATSASDAAHASTEWSLHAPEPIASSLRSWAAATQALHHEAITTVYALAASGLTRPMLALPATRSTRRSSSSTGANLGGRVVCWPSSSAPAPASASPAEAGRRAGARAAGAGRRAPSHHHRKARHLRLYAGLAAPAHGGRTGAAGLWRLHRRPLTRPRSKAPCAARRDAGNLP
jgi:hypothetical protein